MTEIAREIISSMKSPFRRFNSFSEKGNIISKREQDVDTYMRRIKPQIEEYQRRGFTFSTPEEWDSHLLQCTLGKGKRSSTSILSRMTWEQFLLRVDQL